MYTRVPRLDVDAVFLLISVPYFYIIAIVAGLALLLLLIMLIVYKTKKSKARANVRPIGGKLH